MPGEKAVERAGGVGKAGARGPWANRRRAELLQLLDQLEASIEPLDRAVEKEAQQNAAAVRLMSQPGVGPITALAFG